MSAIELTNLTKQYGGVTALQGFDLTVEEGEIYGFLGPNGAGKSTTINILLDFARPTSGDTEVLGHDAQAESKRIRERVGVLPEGFDVYDRLTGRQHLNFTIKSKKSDDDPDALAERVGIADAIDRKAGGYSKGMAQRLVLGMALVGKPDLLILDEPSTGLDPNGAREMREIIRAERDRGATVFFSSHILSQVEAVCDRVGILLEGELVAQDTIEGLRDTTSTEATLVVEVDRVADGVLDEVRTLVEVSEASAEGTTITVSCEDSSKTVVLDTIEDAGVSVENFTTESASLEDLFASYTTDGHHRPADEADQSRDGNNQSDGATVQSATGADGSTDEDTAGRP
ncbi:ABC transporter ATP-binding protein [Halostagnicola kamekurae]|uniref:ABC-2 type transport system ATP-binding protein n=1 Tax=Halostagnicola kamekurae TaxID=619731 RepID=A0A1I6QQC7_9EURY|nr:ABC transporter ATP-binding protein [Halostagnicola kamekurae]SFS54663.1 ABC-2 type transport system ATP-binding protein [Halostagnicola kamekurae]